MYSLITTAVYHCRAATLLLCLLAACQFSHADAFFSLQLRVDMNQESSLQRLTSLNKVHSATFSASEHYVYLGQFTSEQAAQQKLDQIKRDIEPQIQSYSPMIVEIFAPDSAQYNLASDQVETEGNASAVVLPNSKAKKMKREAETAPSAVQAPAVQQHTALAMPTVTAAAVAKDYQQHQTAQDLPQPNNNNRIHVDKGYSIQLAAFQNLNNYHNFMQDYPSGDFYCNSSETLRVVHMGIFDRYSEAAAAMQEAGDFDELKPYIVTLTDSSLITCQ